ncbi:hypothetical protein [Nesterenkonia haasae]|uniref:hypothetical protein n=1 Tax=Nesterenkonia haasae TaxID=2587813 RepID=UPI001391218C|nr:hypothetical protein [Nesterenkonia haasae]NDK31675.1 hypothetical protein [Nesterenkonia haasae]
MAERLPLPLIASETHGFIYVTFTVQKNRGPIFRNTQRRRAYAKHLLGAAAELKNRADVESVRVLRAHLVPPLPGVPRHDFALLIRTPDFDDLGSLRDSEQYAQLGGTECLVGNNAAKIGDTEATLRGTFLLNHFTAPSSANAVDVWKGLTDWYTSTIGVDNSTALTPANSASPYELINYVRLNSPPPVFLLSQLLRPSFHRLVRGALKRHDMRALPAFYRVLG